MRDECEVRLRQEAGRCVRLLLVNYYEDARGKYYSFYIVKSSRFIWASSHLPVISRVPPSSLITSHSHSHPHPNQTKPNLHFFPSSPSYMPCPPNLHPSHPQHISPSRPASHSQPPSPYPHLYTPSPPLPPGPCTRHPHHPHHPTKTPPSIPQVSSRSARHKPSKPN